MKSQASKQGMSTLMNHIQLDQKPYRAHVTPIYQTSVFTFACSGRDPRTSRGLFYTSILQYSSVALVWTAMCAHRFHTGRNRSKRGGPWRTHYGERFLILANNLLERAQMVAGEAEAKLETFAPAELLKGVRDIMDGLARVKGLQLHTCLADDVPDTLYGDPDRLHQILVNLVSNGIKFTETGSVHVRLFLSDTQHWALEVSDTGSGIPEETRARLFEPFELAEDPATRKHAGAGLGLFIVKQVVEMMEGQIALESEVGQGTTFTVVLPLPAT